MVQTMHDFQTRAEADDFCRARNTQDIHPRLPGVTDISAILAALGSEVVQATVEIAIEARIHPLDMNKAGLAFVKTEST